uniref:Ubiquitin-like protein 5 n=1 Tax=Rhinopithecus roxellana TaxID=61622 RepID=A0A2K6QNH1_RHIRO
MIEVVCNDRLGKKVRVKCTRFLRTTCLWGTRRYR